MAQKFTFYPLGNAETCLLELENGGKLLFDYAAVNDGSPSDPHYDIKEELSAIKEFDVVMFSHPHEDHTKGASEFFYLDHTPKYQSEDRAKIKELWISSAFLLETDLENQSDAKIIRNEARHRLKEGYGIKVFAAPDSLKDWLDEHDIDYDDVCSLIVHAGKALELSDALGEEMQVFVRKVENEDGITLPFTYLGKGKMRYLTGPKDNGAHLFRVEMDHEVPDDIFFDFKLPSIS